MCNEVKEVKIFLDTFIDMDGYYDVLMGSCLWIDLMMDHGPEYFHKVDEFFQNFMCNFTNYGDKAQLKILQGWQRFEDKKLAMSKPNIENHPQDSGNDNDCVLEIISPVTLPTPHHISSSFIQKVEVYS